MKLVLRTIYLGLLLLHISCSAEQGANGNQSGLPASSSKVDQVYVYTDAIAEATGLKDAILGIMEQPYLITSRPSPRISIQEREFRSFGAGNNRAASALFIVTMNEESELREFAEATLGSEQIEAAMSSEQLAVLKVNDLHAKPQTLYFILTTTFLDTTNESVRDQLLSFCNQISDNTNTVDNERLAASFSNSRNLELEQNLASKYGANIWIPSDFALVDETENFTWIIRETNDLYSSIVLYKPEDDSLEPSTDVFAFRDELGSRITTEIDGSRMSTLRDKLPKPIQRPLEVDGRQVYETRGLWEMENDDMGGPFINYTWKSDDGIVVMDGFIHYNKEDERRKMRDLDAIFSTLSLK